MQGREKLGLLFKLKLYVNPWPFGVRVFFQGMHCGFSDALEVWGKAVWLAGKSTVGVLYFQGLL